MHLRIALFLLLSVSCGEETNTLCEERCTEIFACYDSLDVDHRSFSQCVGECSERFDSDPGHAEHLINTHEQCGDEQSCAWFRCVVSHSQVK